MKGERIQCLRKHTPPNTVTLALRLLGEEVERNICLQGLLRIYSVADFSEQVYRAFLKSVSLKFLPAGLKPT